MTNCVNTAMGWPEACVTMVAIVAAGAAAFAFFKYVVSRLL